MSILLWIICATVLGGVLSALAAAVFAIKAKIAQIPVLISYAVGTLFGAVFLAMKRVRLRHG
ncbi:MAG: hypothetical protein A2W68_05840 [Betaproteobacteria bacterium RIFCSPLOWO2_02_64_14]|nr:MAG: hypothetical protein A2W68_05840 [Betaproteobacteria bacterium RIFCSPLOWO2_02_64_14]